MDNPKNAKKSDDHGVITAGPKAHANEGAAKPDEQKAEGEAHAADRASPSRQTE